MYARIVTPTLPRFTSKSTGVFEPPGGSNPRSDGYWTGGFRRDSHVSMRAAPREGGREVATGRGSVGCAGGTESLIDHWAG